MQLEEIYRPIQQELRDVEEVLRTNLVGTRNEAIAEMGRYLLDTKGKRLRPALLILSAKATQQQPAMTKESVIALGAAVELLHKASLIHDDVIDHASMRYYKPTINLRYDQEISIVLGDYLYSVGFELIASCRNTDIVSCITQTTKAMCEGELAQVCERDNLDLARERYTVIVKNKTARLFAASCQVGAMISNCGDSLENAMKEYGLNFGIAFQIVDDCLDLLSQEQEIGKDVGCDFRMAELTLPMLNLLSVGSIDREGLVALLKRRDDKNAFCEIKERFLNSEALDKTKEDARAYIRKAQTELDGLENSEFKRSLMGLGDFLEKRIELFQFNH